MVGYSSATIVEIVPTIQCEVSIGTPVILVRLRGCNCHCPWCDTKYSWIKDNKMVDNITDEDIQAVIDVHEKYPNIRTLLITGGEPLLYSNQHNFIQLLNLEGFNFVQIETNGSLLDEDMMCESNFIHHIMFNVSPKLFESYYYNVTDFNNLISNLSRLNHYCEHENGFWGMDYLIKFVYSPEDEELIKDFILQCGFLTNYSINIMSKTPDIKLFNNKHDFLDELRKNDYETIKFCMKYNYRFTPRFHMMQFLGDNNEMMDK